MNGSADGRRKRKRRRRFIQFGLKNELGP